MGTLQSEDEIELSSDESFDMFEGIPPGYVMGSRPYMFEPVKTSDDDREKSDGEEDSDEYEDSESESSESETDDEELPGAAAGGEDRTTMDDVHAWCGCGQCSTDHLTGAREYTCCHEHARLKLHAVSSSAGTDSSVCLTNSEEFRLLCLTQSVLRNVLVCLNNVKADNWQVNPPSNRRLQFAAYNQFVWWVYGRKGSNKRRPVPACAAHAIRTTFPSQNNYVWFHPTSVFDEDN